MDGLHDTMEQILQDILLIGGAIMALWYGLKRIYTTARSIEELLALSKTDTKERALIAETLSAHIRDEEKKDYEQSRVITALASDVSEIAKEVRPNGGSSMKDQLTRLIDEQSSIKERMAAFDQWKRDNE